MRRPTLRLPHLFLLAGALLWAGGAPAQALSDEAAAAKEKYWSAWVGGQWDFLFDDGAPLGGRDWQEVRFGFGRVDRTKKWALLFSDRVVGRTDRFDNVLALEGYTGLVGPLAIRAMAAGSPDHDFTYRVRADAELEWSYKTVVFGAGYWFMDFDATDVHVGTPFFRWHAGDLTVDLRYLAIFDAEGDKLFNAGSIRLERTFGSRWLRPFLGAAGGSRIFGILSVQASPGQEGVLAYVGNRFGLTQEIDCVVTLSYGQEESVFHYVGLGADFKFRF